MKPLDAFYRHRHTRDGHQNQCKACVAPRQAAYRAANKERRAALSSAWHNANRDRVAARGKTYREANKERIAERTPAKRLRQMGLTPERYDELLASQGGGCAICGSADSRQPGARFHIDHDGQAGCCPPNRACDNCRRGLLCRPCNIGIGLFDHDPERLLAAAAYLQRHRELLATQGGDR
jgi:hypothetical protein